MTEGDYYDYEKSKAKTVTEGEIIDGFHVEYVKDGVILVDANCKICEQQLRLFEALGRDGVCQECA